MAQIEIRFRAYSYKWDKMIYHGVDGYTIDVMNQTAWLDSACDQSVALMQFTGLHDKNGKDIDEGDILASIYGVVKPCEIKFGEFRDYITEEEEYDDTIVGFYWNEDGDKKSAFGKSINGNMDHCEIKGNIYETPELLK